MVRAWIDAQGWSGLRPIQKAAFSLVAARSTDVLIRAGTASGKTEAAFLPVVSAILADGDARGSLRCLCISPMKALINDQFARLEALGHYCDLSVARWHGDVPAAAKRAARDNAPEILIITPESLELQLARHSHRWSTQIADLDWIIVDELHLFLGRSRGVQLESLMHRLELLVGHRPARLGLSATLGSTDEAERVLGGAEARPVTIVSDEGPTDFDHDVVVTLPLRRDERDTSSEPPGEATGPERRDDDQPELVDAIWERYPGGSYVLFANSRTMVEDVADRLPRHRHRTDVTVAPHHGSLSTPKRSDAERLLMDRDAPSIVVATSTLEVGIDVPAVAAVGQVGPPLSVAALRQRLGRSGRRGDVPRVDVYVPMEPHTDRDNVIAALQVDLVHVVAALELAREGWSEPAVTGVGQLSTLVHQMISVVQQHGGLPARRLFDVVIGSGAFQPLGEREFIDVVRALGEADVLEQDEQRDIVLGSAGESIARSPSFAAVFETPVEYVVMDAGSPLGSVVRQPWMQPGDPLVFAGRRWVILAIDDRQAVIRVQADDRRKLPTWTGGVLPVHPELRARMREVHLRGSGLILPPPAQSRLRQACAAAADARIEDEPIYVVGRTVMLFAYGGTLQHETMVAMLRASGLVASDRGIAVGVTVDVSSDQDSRTLVRRHLDGILSTDWDPIALVAHLSRRAREKFDDLVPPALLDEETARTQVDVEGALALIRRLVGA